jgi:deoxyribonuclease-4
MQRLGFHVSIAGGVEKSIIRAQELSINSIQIFSHNPRSWKTNQLNQKSQNDFKALRRENDVTPVFIHASYLINLASSKTTLIDKSVNLLSFEMDRADEIGADYVVVHTGTASGDEPSVGRKRVVQSLNHLFSGKSWKAGLLLENTAGEKGDVSSTIGELAQIRDGLKGDFISGICFDTCHAFAAGYDIRKENEVENIIDEINHFFGLSSLKLIHLNDAKGDCGSRRDRHEHIGVGKIGIEGFKTFFKKSEFQHIPLILETPKKNDDDDRRNLDTLRKILSDIYGPY